MNSVLTQKSSILYSSSLDTVKESPEELLKEAKQKIADLEEKVC